MRILFIRNFAYAYAKFRENKTLAKISEFTVPCGKGFSNTYISLAEVSVDLDLDTMKIF